ncbi:MAG: DUF2207 domain-containing protein [Bacilli bacterium]|nr:DUF2207 domain-containing protein [Bacilli bacterium]
MDNKKWHKIDITLICLFFISLIIDVVIIFNQEDLNGIFTLPKDKMLFTVGFLLFMALFINIMKFFFIGGIYLAIKKANKKVYREKLSKIDVKKYKGYFRHILEGYTPAELSYIDDFNLDYPKDYIAMLLSLKNKKVIDFDEVTEKIIIINRNAKLTKAEELILNNIVDGKLQRINDYNFSCTVQNDAFEKGILKQSVKKINFKKLGIIALFIFLLFFFMTNIDFEIQGFFAVVVFIIFFFAVFGFAGAMFFLPIYGIVYLVKKTSNPYVRSDAGEEINIRLEGLKNYLKDFSYMDGRNSKELIIWEDYLIYSVLFNQNEKVIDEIKNKYLI